VARVPRSAAADSGGVPGEVADAAPTHLILSFSP